MLYPKVSIVIPVYNGANYLADAIESALAQTYLNCEVIVVNDGSSDAGKTASIANRYKEKIRYFEKENGGVSSALNFAIKNMKGELFSWLSHDDMYDKNKVLLQVNAALEQGSMKTLVWSDYRINYIISNTSFSSNLLNRYPRSALEDGCFCVWMSCLNFCSLLIHKSHFERVGLFDEKLRTTQDYEMGFRLLNGQKVIFVDEPLVIARAHEEQGSKTEPTYHGDRVELFKKALCSNILMDECKSIFESEYKFYSEILPRLKGNGFVECQKIVRERLIRLQEPEDVKDNIKTLLCVLNNKYKMNLENLYIFGSGVQGVDLYYRFKYRGIKVNAFIDNNFLKQGKTIDGIPCVSLNTLLPSKAIIIISIDNSSGIVDQLIEAGFSNILIKNDLIADLYNTVIDKEYL